MGPWKIVLPTSGFQDHVSLQGGMGQSQEAQTVALRDVVGVGLQTGIHLFLSSLDLDLHNRQVPS